MRKTNLCLLTLLILWSTYSHSQSYHPFPDSNARWSEQSVMHWVQQGTNTYVYDVDGFIYAMVGDTIINGQSYHLIGNQLLYYYETDNSIYDVSINNSFVYPGTVFGAIREDSSKKIWFRSFVLQPPICQTYFPYDNFPIDSDILLYDFNLNLGQNISYPFPRTVVAIDSVQLQDGSLRRRIVFQPLYNVPDNWIEGIGSEFGLFGSYLKYPPLPDDSCSLKCYTENTQHLYQKSLPAGVTCDSLNVSELTGISPASTNSFKIFPNPFTTSTTITLTNYTAPFNLQLFDELGREAQLQYHSMRQGSRTTLTIDRGELLSGMYFLSVASGEKRDVVKVMVE